ncbi:MULTISPECIES: pirin family protein [unclassified Pseudomonas]|uniref:pirin family protein n=1 Tax=unclassified Pseudomonas TaxID=196821 RepID=UPI000D382D2A|nr:MULTISPECIES: pirin family protein [unclassified Pseudomonas]RAU47932.1 pirin family protein [Pseudomonas sp. RIT 409]RAU55374.1 pirin family protein [Pseudomonas sp. RIT 412]
MSHAAEKTNMQLRQITHRTHGQRNGAAVRLMSPSDFGQILKPFVFLDFFDMQGPPFVGDLHPHSGIATLSYLIDGRMDLIDPDGTTVVLPSGGVEWMQAGKGMWHGGSVSSAIETPSPMNFLAVKLKAGDRWTYVSPSGHTVLWVSPVEGGLLANDEKLHPEELVAFERSSQSVHFEALTDTQFILGSATPHKHDLALSYYSVHTSPQALKVGEAQIQTIGKRLVEEGRLDRRYIR